MLLLLQAPTLEEVGLVFELHFDEGFEFDQPVGEGLSGSVAFGGGGRQGFFGGFLYPIGFLQGREPDLQVLQLICGDAAPGEFR